MRQRISTLLLVVLLGVLVAACGGGGTGGPGSGGVSRQELATGNSYIHCPTSTNTTAARAETGPVTLTVSGFTSSPAEDALVQQNLHNFEKLHANITINWSPIPGDYTTKMRANVASNTVPDVFYLQPLMSNEYISAGKLLNLSPYMARDEVRASAYYATLLNPFV
ncbi:MAG TPA: extracellular solute-binding protein, partial [Ktedonobacteraceae bacterium]|nr:extracellular solute-binding protein [Ktedonobacteraceae bacterium]